MMGEFAAEFPTDRLYAKNHMWAQPRTESHATMRFGFSAYAVRLLQDVYFLDWIVDAPQTLGERQEIGAIESKKAESDLFAPISGALTQFNPSLMKDPSQINVDTYGGGWLFEMTGQADSLLDPAGYIEHLADVWELTQKTIKGQLNS
jgi:glycine cleavage system H protein